ncbi:MAG: single-stranded DNA-binding protein [Patescibacteria group bacterium]
MNLNKVFILGNLTRDPEMKSLPSGQPVTTFGMATNRTWKAKSGQKETQVEYHNIVLFGRLAEIANQYLTKGRSAFIEGRIQTRSWQDKDGQKKYKTEVIAEGLQLGPRGTGESGAAPAPAAPTPPPQEELQTVEYPADEINPDDIPF